MKTHTLTIALAFCSIAGLSQVSQDSINKMQAEINNKQAKVNATQKEINKEQTVVNALQDEMNKRSNSETDELVQSILNDLVAMKIIDNKEKVSFALSSDKMEVNGKQQPTEVHKKFATKYKVVAGYAIAYAKSRNNTSTSITKS